MKKMYHFWSDKNQKVYNQENSYSSYQGTLVNAKKWAILLLAFNTSFNTVFFISHGGKKIYSVDRKNLPLDK